MLPFGSYYADCNVRICHYHGKRKPPIFSGRIRFNGFAEFIEILEKKLRLVTENVDRMSILYKASNKQYIPLLASEQEFLLDCKRSNITIAYFPQRQANSAVVGASSAVAQPAEPLVDGLDTLVKNLRRTFATWTGTDKCWDSLAQYYKSHGLTGNETIDVPMKLQALFTIGLNEPVNLPVTSHTNTLTTNVVERVTSSQTPTSLVETSVQVDVQSTQQQEIDLKGAEQLHQHTQPGLYYPSTQACIPQHSMTSAAPLTNYYDASEARYSPPCKSANLSDSLVCLSLPKVSAKAAYLITGIVYADIQAREESHA